MLGQPTSSQPEVVLHDLGVAWSLDMQGLIDPAHGCRLFEHLKAQQKQPSPEKERSPPLQEPPEARLADV